MSRNSMIVAALCAVAAILSVYAAAERIFWGAELKRAETRAVFLRTTLEDALERFQHLPFVVARDRSVVRALAPEHRLRLSRRLQAFARQANVDALYFLDRGGDVLAASNYAGPQSFIGQNYRFRPYFTDAIAGRHGEYYAVGATTRKPGFFIASGVADQTGAAVGAIAVKVDLSPLQRAWRLGGETILVANRDGVVVLASEPRWLFKSLTEIPADRRRKIAAERQFGDEDLARLDWRSDGADQAALDGARRLHVAEPVGRLGWTLHYLADPNPVRERALLAAVFGAAALGLFAAIAMALRSARLRAALRRSEEHSQALRAANRDLQRTQSELARASKMATLGQLAASVAHELGQPISAMRNHLAAAEINGSDQVRRETLTHIGGIVRRMETITAQLKTLARPQSRAADRVDLHDVIDGARFLLRHDLEAEQVRLRIQTAPAPVIVRGDRLRLEQVLINLMKNAMAAMAASETRLLSVRAAADGAEARLEVADTGHGVGAWTLEQLREPFQTTRPSGQGMGLGLAIASEIIQEHGGALEVRDGPGGGAVFTVALPLAPPEPAPTEARATEPAE